MRPVTFDQINKVFKKPADMTDDQCGDLGVCETTDKDGYPVIVSCWELTEEELQEIIKTKRVWLGVLGAGTPPVWLSGTNPFKQPETEELK
jgi:hypothetical protein